MTRRYCDQEMAAGAAVGALELTPATGQAVEVAPGGVTDLLAAVEASVRGALGQVEVAESMIEAALRADPAHADVLWHSFGLLRPTCDRMNTEFVYRAHVRELLERVKQAVLRLMQHCAEAPKGRRCWSSARGS
jgi:hypothetical protein